jgi:hypothetical protein
MSQYVSALESVFPPPAGIKTVEASASARKMLAFWSVPNRPKVTYVRDGDKLIGKAKLTSCPACHTQLSAQLVRLSDRERSLAEAFPADPEEPEQAPGASPQPEAVSGAEDRSAHSQTVPYARFKEVNDQLNAFQELGFSPQELAVALTALAGLIQQAESQQHAGSGQAQPTAQGINANADGSWNPVEFERWILQQLPWLGQLKTLYESSQKR